MRLSLEGSLSKAKFIFTTVLLAFLLGPHGLNAKVRYVCPRLEGTLFSGCKTGSVHQDTQPIQCNGICYEAQTKIFPYTFTVPGQPAYAGDTRFICPGGEKPGTPCTNTYSNEGIFLGCLGGTGPQCPGGYTTEIIPGTSRAATADTCNKASYTCITSYKEVSNSDIGGSCACGSFDPVSRIGNGDNQLPAIPACNVPASQCIAP